MLKPTRGGALFEMRKSPIAFLESLLAIEKEREIGRGESLSVSAHVFP